MELIPAIDLQDGTVVCGQGGERVHYRPLHSNLFPSAQPSYVIQKLLSLFDIDTVYIADLSAIEKRGDNSAIINEIHGLFPTLQIILDNGISDSSPIQSSPRITPIVGTETLQIPLTDLQSFDYILSLDFKNKRLIGRDVLQDTALWPPQIIVLSIDHIGRQSGMDFELLREIRERYRGCIFAGGGLSSQDDLRHLEQIGIDGVIAGSALYTGRVTPDMF